MISKLSEINIEDLDLGGKGQRLLELNTDGYLVPKFLVITTHEVESLQKNEAALQRLCDNIRQSLPCASYAVRSAALVEDSKMNSYAGQFKTVLDVDPGSLSQAILSVVNDATAKLKNAVQGKFSVIVQQFILPDFAGVIYTRNPIAGREMVVEYGEGLGDKIVGGEQVKRLEFLYSDNIAKFAGLDFVQELAGLANRLEKKYDFPQDMEWLVKNGVIYILQTRPITSVGEPAWSGIKLIEAELAETQGGFFFEKTALSETFKSPKPLALSLLKELYKEGGPIQKAYARLSVKYSAKDTLKQFGNELYVNKELEIKSIYPSFGYLKQSHEKIEFELNFGIGTTLKNFLALTFASGRLSKNLAKELQLVITNLPDKCNSPEEASLQINKYYEIIFLINILADQALFKLETNLGKYKNFVPQLLQDSSFESSLKKRTGLIGNSFNLDDETDFVSFSDMTKEVRNYSEEDWWSELPDWKRRGLTTYIVNAQRFSALREGARYLSVILVNLFREAVLLKSEEVFPENRELIYYSTLSEIIANKIDKKLCVDRMELYKQNTKIQTPAYVASFIKEQSTSADVVSIAPGEAEGVFVNEDTIMSVSGPKILVTDILSPELVKYFDQLEGILSKQGGLLSHLAIMAREANLPVVVSSVNNNQSLLGKSGRIDGTKGTVFVNK